MAPPLHIPHLPGRFLLVAIDMTYYCLRLMEGLGLVWDIKDVPVYVREGKSKQDAIAV